MASADKAAFDLAKRKAGHWAWQPIKSQNPPSVKDGAWPKGRIDRFVLAKLEEKGLEPAPAADRRALIRRLSFDLTGLPPKPEEVEAFAADTSPDAIEKVVDRLLGSEHFGERWARHWLDLVRYAETRGHEFDYDIPSAWRYRDYVIRAYNADVPYDQFVTEHVAGDLLPEPRLDKTGTVNESVIATGFWHFNEWVHSPVDIREDETNRVNNQDRRLRQGLPRPDDRLRPLPRPQVRRRQPEGLLRAGRLHQQRELSQRPLRAPGRKPRVVKAGEDAGCRCEGEAAAGVGGGTQAGAGARGGLPDRGP